MMLPSLVAASNILILMDIAKNTPPGSFMELGVYQGGTASALDMIAKLQGRSLHLFDTFTGIPVASQWDHHKIGDFNDTDVELVKAVIPDATYYVGFFPDTLPDDFNDIAFAHIDCDQYESVCDACRLLPGRMVKGGVLYFDDYNALPGATKAVDECLPDRVILNNGKAIYVVT
jgi:hypothetical protein